MAPSRNTWTVSFSESAFTTETPTPCRPPEIRYPPPPNLPPAFSVVRTTSTAGRRSLAFGMGFTGMPRPLSSTEQPPSFNRRTTIRSQNPAIASSIELSTTSYTRWWSPRALVVPMYIPGRRRTCSTPSNTWMSDASYFVGFFVSFATVANQPPSGGTARGTNLPR